MLVNVSGRRRRHAPALSARGARWHFATSCLCRGNEGGGDSGPRLSPSRRGPQARHGELSSEPPGRAGEQAERGGMVGRVRLPPRFISPMTRPLSSRRWARARSAAVHASGGPRPDPPPELAAAQPVAKCHWASRTERVGACKRNAPVRKSCRLQATTRSVPRASPLHSNQRRAASTGSSAI